MQKRWTALILAALMLVTTSCGRTAQPQEDVSGSAPDPLDPRRPAPPKWRRSRSPVKEPPAWETGRTVEHLPDNYNGLELPIQGATGYTSVELPLWADPADQGGRRHGGGGVGEGRGGAKAAGGGTEALRGGAGPRRGGGRRSGPGAGGDQFPLGLFQCERRPGGADHSGPRRVRRRGDCAGSGGRRRRRSPRRGTSSAQTGTDPAQPGETPGGRRPPAVQEPAPGDSGRYAGPLRFC